MCEWIPMSERIPLTKKNEWKAYLICDKTGYIGVCNWYDGWNCSYDCETGGVCREHEFKDVVAWMPLPKPYVQKGAK